MISFVNSTMMFGPKILWNDVNIALSFKKKYSIVGGNGSGKSTLLRLLSGVEESIGGEIKFSGTPSIGFLRQDQFVDEEMMVIDLVIKGNSKLWEIKLKRNIFYEKTHLTQEEGCELAIIEDEYFHNGGYEAESRAAKLLIGLSIEEKLHYEKLKTLSGGYRIRTLLAQSLFNDPDILLLDEPTNHLDIISIEWLEKYLKNSYKGTLILISHDKNFVNSVANYILDIDYADIRLYTGNYNSFEKQKQVYCEQIQKQRETNSSRIDKLQTFISRFAAKATMAKQAKSKQKMIDRIDLPDIERSSRQYPNFDFNLRLKEPQGKQLLKVENLSHGFNADLLFTNLNFKIHQGEKILILGPNGVGKSTLLKILLKEIEPLDGDIKWSERANVAYISQQHLDQLDPNSTLRNWLLHEVANLTESQCRKTLANVLFRKEEVDKKISILSGGECTRLLLARAMASEQNFLVMDEPTNHLDMEAISSLATSLKAYKGTVVLVSHDRSFSSSIANRLLIMNKHKVDDFEGNYNEYMTKYHDSFFE